MGLKQRLQDDLKEALRAKGHPFLSVGLCTVAPKSIHPDPLKETFGDRDQWAEQTGAFLKAHGFNTIGSWSAWRLIRQTEQRIPYTRNWSFMAAYKNTRPKRNGARGCPQRCMPIFDPAMGHRITDEGPDARRRWEDEAIPYLLIEARSTPAVTAYSRALFPLNPGSAAEIDKNSRPWRLKYVRFRGPLEYIREEEYESTYRGSDPPLGRIGMTETEARASGRRVLVGKRPMSNVGRAREFGETQGFIKVLVDADTEEILGAAILGLSGDEAVHCLLDVMYAKKPYAVISRAVHIHPTVTELVPTVLQNLKPLQSLQSSR